MKSSLIWIAYLAHLVLAKVGDSCTYSGLKGKYIPTGDCDNGFTVTGRCPKDPANVKCCLSKTSTSSSGDKGKCLNTATACSGSFVKNRCPGPSDVQCCVAASNPPEQELEVVFWINCFIPRDINGITKPIPKHTGQTMIVGLTEALEDIVALGGCFATDQRAFSSDQQASSRMHSEATIRINAGGYDWSQRHHCGSTIKVDCDDGHTKKTKTADTNKMDFALVSGSSSKVVLSYDGKAHNPFDTLAPKIDIKGTLTVDRANSLVTFNGMVDEFPAFEAYALLNGFGPYRIADIGPKDGAGADSLAGGANCAFSGELYV